MEVSHSTRLSHIWQTTFIFLQAFSLSFSISLVLSTLKCAQIRSLTSPRGHAAKIILSYKFNALLLKVFSHFISFYILLLLTWLCCEIWTKFKTKKKKMNYEVREEEGNA